MRPSDIIIDWPTPLTGVFEHVEAEQAAALMILTLASSYSEWGAVKPKEIGVFLRDNRDDLGWMNNPFIRPDIDDLIERGFAEWIGDDEKDRSRAVRFTPHGLRELRRSRWNRARDGDQIEVTHDVR